LWRVAAGGARRILPVRGNAPGAGEMEKRRRAMRRMTVVVTVALVVLLVAGPALALTCPKLQKEAGEAIAKAEGAVAKVADAKAKAAAQAMVDLAKELNKASEASHKKAVDTKGVHYRAEAEAKAAKAVAGMAGM